MMLFVGEIEARIAETVKQKHDLELSKEKTVREIRRLMRKGGTDGSITGFLTGGKRQKRGSSDSGQAGVSVPLSSGYNRALIGVYNGVLSSGGTRRLEHGCLSERALGRISAALFSTSAPSLAAVTSLEVASTEAAGREPSPAPPLWSLSSDQHQPGFEGLTTVTASCLPLLPPEEIRLVSDTECEAGLCVFYVDEYAQLARAAAEEAAAREMASGGGGLYDFISQRSPQSGCAGTPEGPFDIEGLGVDEAIQRLLRTRAGLSEADIEPSLEFDMNCVAGAPPQGEGDCNPERPCSSRGDELSLLVQLASRYGAALRRLILYKGECVPPSAPHTAVPVRLLPSQSQPPRSSGSGSGPVRLLPSQSQPPRSSGSGSGSGGGYSLHFPSQQLCSPQPSASAEIDLVSPEAGVVAPVDPYGGEQDLPSTQCSAEGGGGDCAGTSGEILVVDLSAASPCGTQTSLSEESEASPLCVETVVATSKGLVRLPLQPSASNGGSHSHTININNAHTGVADTPGPINAHTGVADSPGPMSVEFYYENDDDWE